MTEVICETGDVNPFAAHIHTPWLISILKLVLSKLFLLLLYWFCLYCGYLAMSGIRTHNVSGDGIKNGWDCVDALKKHISGIIYIKYTDNQQTGKPNKVKLRGSI
jgi:hypothetical protein